MPDKRTARDQIPEHFASLDEAGEFWDTHDLADYDDMTQEVQFEVDLKSRTFLTALEPDLARKVADYAHQQGVSTETLINVWLTEKLMAARSSG
ncbi:MAG: hypothetical protein GY719_39510 [bacterium]|nr:hypothetical protein [bacterium]